MNKIKYFGLNSFIIQNGKVKIAIDPGSNVFGIRQYSLIPKSEWEGVTHIFVTHGDPDHFKYAIPMAKKTGANVFCGNELEKDFRSEGISEIHPLSADDLFKSAHVTVEGLKAKHGPLNVEFGKGLMEINLKLSEGSQGSKAIFLASKKIYEKKYAANVRDHGTIKLLFGLIRLEKDNVDFARGSIGFKITIGDKSFVNLGDTLLCDDWEGLAPDVLMIPIGGRDIKNTMDEQEALKAVSLIKPGKVIPCHYKADFLWKKDVVMADDEAFRKEVERMGIECRVMQYNDEIYI